MNFEVMIRNQWKRFLSSVHFVLCLLIFLFTGPFASPGGAAAGLQSIEQEYFEVLRSGDANRLRQALDKGTAPNARDSAGNTPLMWAAVYGDAACVRLLVDRGADVNAT